MFSIEQKIILDALRRSLCSNKNMADSSDIDFCTVTNYIRRNGILPTVYPSIGMHVGLQRILQTEYYATINQIVNQVYEGERVIAALNFVGISCLPMKGWDVRRLYPNPMMRQMTDLDVLVHHYDYQRICDVMDALGFNHVGDESAEKHEVFHKGTVTVEVHKRISDEIGAVRKWESGLWDRAIRDSDGYLKMSDEDVYLAHFEHMYRDFRNGWFGLRRVVDAWLLDQHFGELDQTYLQSQMDAMGLSQFCERMCWLGRVMMGEEPMVEDAEKLLQYAFNCGIFGNEKSHKTGRVVSLSNEESGLAIGKARSVLAHLFLPFNRMRAQYPVLESWPALLPICWLRRIAHYLRSGDLKRYLIMLDYHDVTEEDVDSMRDIMRIAGV